MKRGALSDWLDRRLGIDRVYRDGYDTGRVHLRGAALALAQWTQHHHDCARAESTAHDCDCGLQRAWERVER